MPTITVEDGSGVADANSYIDVTYLDTYAANLGLTLPAATETKETYLLVAMEYLEWYTDNWLGSKAVGTNSLPWPRDDVWLEGFELDDDEIPELLKKAQAQLVVEQEAGVALWPEAVTSVSEGFVTQSTLGPLTEKYNFVGAGTASAYSVITLPKVKTLLKNLLASSSTSLRTVKV